MKKVAGYISTRLLGSCYFKFYVPDNIPDEEIEEMIKDRMEFYYNYDVEYGYEEYTEVSYRKKG